MIVIVDGQVKQGSLGECQKLNIQGINVLKGTPGKNVKIFRNVQVFIYKLFKRGSFLRPYGIRHHVFVFRNELYLGCWICCL